MRNFGISNVTSRSAPGAQPPIGSHCGSDTHAAESYLLPAGSLRFAPVDKRTKERASLTFFAVFIALCFATPLILAGIIMRGG